jgi:hypothetical protein
MTQSYTALPWRRDDVHRSRPPALMLHHPAEARSLTSYLHSTGATISRTQTFCRLGFRWWHVSNPHSPRSRRDRDGLRDVVDDRSHDRCTPPT